MVRFNIQTEIACLMGLMILLFQPVQAQQIPSERLEVYVQLDTLRVDASIDSLFSKRAIDAIESGMTTSIVIQFRLLLNNGNPLSGRTVIKRLEHDIWEGQYRLIKQAIEPDTLYATRFEDIQKACSELQGLALAVLPLPDVPITLQARLDVNPISPEQQERTRKWLKVLKKGSLLEFFFSLEKPTPSNWIDLLIFRPNVLPHLLQETQP